MFTLTQHQTIDRPAPEVFDFLAHFENRPRFESAVVEAVRLDEGPLDIGSRYREVRRAWGIKTTSEYAIRELDPPRRLRFESISGPIPVEGLYEISQDEGSSLVTFTLTMRPGGSMRLFEPIFARTTKRDLAGYYETLKRVLEAG